MINKAIILAAGRGTRFYPYTKYVAKEMLPEVDVPAIQLICEEAIASGIHDICIITSHEKHSMNSFFESYTANENNVKITLVFQKVANGTGAALLLAEHFCNGQPAVVMNGDDLMYTEEGKTPVTKQLVDCFEECNCPVIGVQPVPEHLISKYGSIRIAERNGRTISINGIVEKPAPENAPSLLSSLGRYVITPEVFDYLKELKPSHKGEYIFTDALDAIAREKGMVAYDFEGTRYDLGSKTGYMEALTDYALRREDIAEEYLPYLRNIVSKLGIK